MVMGMVAGVVRDEGRRDRASAAVLATGVLGGYTTFSAFSLDAILLWEGTSTCSAALYVGGSVVGSLLGLVAGLWIVRTALA